MGIAGGVTVIDEFTAAVAADADSRPPLRGIAQDDPDAPYVTEAQTRQLVLSQPQS